MVNKVEKIKIEDESNGNGNNLTSDDHDNGNGSNEEVDNNFEDEEQVSSIYTVHSLDCYFLSCVKARHLFNLFPSFQTIQLKTQSGSSIIQTHNLINMSRTGYH